MEREPEVESCKEGQEMVVSLVAIIKSVTVRCIYMPMCIHSCSVGNGVLHTCILHYVHGCAFSYS